MSLKNPPQGKKNLTNDNRLYLLLAISLLVSIFKINFIPISFHVDSSGYILFSKNLFNHNPWESRPFGYPLFLKISMIFKELGFILTIYLQLLIQILAVSLIYLIFRNYSKNIAFFSAIIFLTTPSFQLININILADAIYIYAPIFLIFLIYYFKDNLNIFNISLILLLAFFIATLRQSFVVIFYLIILSTVIIYFFEKIFRINLFLRKFIYSGFILSCLFLITFNFLTSDFSKHYGIHQMWIMKTSISKCGNQKCFELKNGKYAEEYFKLVSEIIDKDKGFNKVLRSNYDFKDSITTSNKDLENLKSSELLQYIHQNSYKHTPFVYIYGSMVNNIGFDKTYRIIRNITIETIFKKPSFLINDLLQIFKKDNFFNLNLKNNSQAIKDLLYFALVPTSSSSLKDQGLTFYETITSKEYSQLISGLESFSGKTILEYNQLGKKFYYLHNKLYDKNFIKEKLKTDDNKLFYLFFLISSLNLYFLIFYKIIIFIVIPFFTIYFVGSVYSKNKLSFLTSMYFISIILFYSIFLVSIILAPQNVDRHIILNLSILFPAIVVLLLKIKEILELK